MWIEDLKSGFYLVEREGDVYRNDLYKLTEQDLKDINNINSRFNRAPVTFERLLEIGFIKMGPTGAPNSDYNFQIMLIGHGWFKVYSHFGMIPFSFIHDKENNNSSDVGEPVKYIDELQHKIYELSGIVIGRR